VGGLAPNQKRNTSSGELTARSVGEAGVFMTTIKK